MSSAPSIDDENNTLIEQLSQEGNVLAEKNDFDGAIRKFEQALAIVPAPKDDWEASLWLYSSIGDMYHFKSDYKNSLENFNNALNCPDGQVNAFVHLRLGQALFELKQDDKALDHLLRAYMLEGNEIFDGEDEKYFRFLSENVELE